MKQNFNIERLSHTLIVILILILFITSAKVILQPVFFAVIFTLLLRPLVGFIEKWLKSRTLAIVLAFIFTIVPIGGTIWIFSKQALDIFKRLPSLGEGLQSSVLKIYTQIADYLSLETQDFATAITDNIQVLVDTSVSILRNGFNQSTSLLLGMILALLMTYFLLFYRTAFKEFIIVQSVKSKQENARNTILDIQSLVIKYFYGMLIVIAILAVLNSLGLYFIGIDYALFWGVLAACLAIIPFVGSIVGGLLPFVYAIATTDTLWQPLAVVIMYFIVQQVEGNIITPKVVGNSIKINPLVAILALLIGGVLWGIAGLVLALPIVAIIKLLMENVDGLKTVSLLMSKDLKSNSSKFMDEYNENKYRLPSLFSSTSSFFGLEKEEEE